MYEKMIEQLKNGELPNIEISKGEFLKFREILVKDERFKHFRGIAQQGGGIVFTFMDHPRS